MTRIRSLVVVVLVLVLGAAFVAQAHAQRSGGRSRGSLLGLLGIEQVQKELKLDDEAVAKVEKLREKIRGEMTEQYSAAREIEDRAKRFAKYAELRDQYNQKARKGHAGEQVDQRQPHHGDHGEAQADGLPGRTGPAHRRIVR